MMLAEKWQKDLDVYREIHTTFIIEGNIHDFQPWLYEDDGSCEPLNLNSYLHRYLSEIGYSPIVFYNRIDGFYNQHSQDMVSNFFRIVDTDQKNVNTICKATEAIRKALSNSTRPSAIVVELANTIAISPDNLSDEEIEYYTRLMLSSRTPTQAIGMRDNKPLNNLLFLLVEKVNDIPTWFYLNNPYVRTLKIGRPEKEIRAAVIDARIDRLDGASILSTEDRQKYMDEFVSLTEGMTLVELFGIFDLCRKKKYGASQIREAVRMFRYGETESHWDKLDSERIKNAEVYLRTRVKGQDTAIKKVSEILSRASLGMTGIQGGSTSRPKGVLFLAGPTGTGKTELAKTIAEFVFGDDSFVTRFDMSEYQQPHSDQKLLGAPPGYIGYSDGGQLTNAIKAKPFCVFLFDEIEKAHPSILDKFLQILEDGRITDSTGETVYFSESLIVFTSNLGVVSIDNETGTRFQTVNSQMAYEEIQNKLLISIKDYFKYTIQRPELLNRIGDNFIVFDFIREKAASEILDLKLKAITTNLLRTKNINLTYSNEFKEHLLREICKDLSNGGRGISNYVETNVVNPLAQFLRQSEWSENATITIEINEKNNTYFKINSDKQLDNE